MFETQIDTHWPGRENTTGKREGREGTKTTQYVLCLLEIFAQHFDTAETARLFAMFTHCMHSIIAV